MDTTAAKKDLVLAGLEEELGVGHEEAQRTLRAVLAVVKRELLKGSPVVLPDFASLKVVEKKAEIVKDPQTGHQYISPAKNVVSFTPIDSFQQAIESARLASILLCVPKDDPFAQVIDFHFSRVGWQVHLASTTEQCVHHLREYGAHLVIVDFTLPEAPALLEELKVDPQTSRIPLIAIYPADRDPERAGGFQITADEHLVEPFEVYTLLLIAESELARSSEEEASFDQRVAFQLGTSDEAIERAAELAGRLFRGAGLDEEGQLAFGYAFREALLNAAQHGNEDDPEKKVRVEYLLDHEKVTVVVEDDGPGFDHRAQAARVETDDAVAAARERHSQGRVGGLGILVMRRCADKVAYNDKGNQVTLTKYRPAPQAP